MKFVFVVAALVALLPSVAASQPPAAPTAPRTKLEAFEAQEGVVIIQGFSRIGELRGSFGGTVAVLAKEFTNATTGKRESGIVIAVKEGGRLERSNRSFIDYDEIAALLKGIDYIGKVEKTVTKLENFQADYRTNPKFPLPQEGMVVIFLTKACRGARAFWLQGEGDPEPIEGALLERGRRRDFVELDRRG